MRILLSALAILVLFSCKTNQNGSSPNDEGPSENRNQILFLNYKIIHDPEAKTDKVEFINHIITDGKLKEDNLFNGSPQPGDLQCVLLDKKMKPLKSIIISNPLHKTFEFANEEGKLEKKTSDSGKCRVFHSDPTRIGN